jgi:hypothetical protein
MTSFLYSRGFRIFHYPRFAELRVSANVTADFGIVTGLGLVLGCAGKIVLMRVC